MHYLRSKSSLTSPSSMAFCRSSLRLLFSCCRASFARLRRKIVSFSALTLTEFSEPALWKIKMSLSSLHHRYRVTENSDLSFYINPLISFGLKISLQSKNLQGWIISVHIYFKLIKGICEKNLPMMNLDLDFFPVIILNCGGWNLSS